MTAPPCNGAVNREIEYVNETSDNLICGFQNDGRRNKKGKLQPDSQIPLGGAISYRIVPFRNSSERRWLVHATNFFTGSAS